MAAADLEEVGRRDRTAGRTARALHLAVTAATVGGSSCSRLLDDEVRTAASVALAHDGPLVHRLVAHLRHRLGVPRLAAAVAAEVAALGGPAVRAVLADAIADVDDLLDVVDALADGASEQLAVRRALTDAAARTIDEGAVLRLTRDDRADLGRLVADLQPMPSSAVQSHLFEHLRGATPSPRLEAIGWRVRLDAVPAGARRAVLARPEAIALARLSPRELTTWLGEPLDAEAWAAVLPTVPLGDLVDLLPTLDAAGLHAGVLETAARRLAAPGALDGSSIGIGRLAVAADAADGRWVAALVAAQDGLRPTRLAGRVVVVVDVDRPLDPASGAIAAAIAGAADEGIVLTGDASFGAAAIRRDGPLAVGRAITGAAVRCEPATPRADRLVVVTDRASRRPPSADRVTTFVVDGDPGHDVGPSGHDTFGGFTDAALPALAAQLRLDAGQEPW